MDEKGARTAQPAFRGYIPVPSPNYLSKQFLFHLKIKIMDGETKTCWGYRSYGLEHGVNAQELESGKEKSSPSA